VQIQKNALYCARYRRGKDLRRDSWAPESWTAEMYQREAEHLSKEPSQCLTCRSSMQGVSGAGSRTGGVAGWAGPRKAWRGAGEDTANVRREGWRSASESATRNRGDRVRTHLARRTLQLLRRLSSKQCRRVSQSALSLEGGLSLVSVYGGCDSRRKLRKDRVGLQCKKTRIAGSEEFGNVDRKPKTTELFQMKDKEESHLPALRHEPP
jgi:hypothetical protein